MEMAPGGDMKKAKDRALAHERDANRQLTWTMFWSLAILALSIVSALRV